MSRITSEIFQKQLNKLWNTKPNMKSFLSMVLLINRNPWMSNGYTDFIDGLEVNANWHEWFVQNSCLIMTNESFKAMLSPRHIRRWMMHLSSNDCSEECIKKTLHVVLTDLSKLAGEDISRSYCPFLLCLEPSDPFTELYIRLLTAYNGDKLRSRVTSQPVLDLVNQLGGKKMIKHWYKCLKDTGLTSNSSNILNEL